MSKPVALITGGGSGIGLALAEHLINSHPGYRVAILDVDAERGEAASKRLNLADNCLFRRVDVTDYDQQAQAFQQAFDWGGGRLDMFVANAGIGDQDSVYKELRGVDGETGLPRPVDLRTFDVNLNAVIQGVHLARHFFLRNSRSGGKIVVTSSCLGVYSNHCLPLYTASKHALVGFVRSTAPVFAGMDITINALLPVMIETNLMPEAIRPLWDENQLTPMSTAVKAIDRILRDEKLTGQTIELSLDQLVFSQQQAYSTLNAKWMCEEHRLWEMACEPLLPKPPGENVAGLQ
ncbi:hypothetical protein B0A55_07262 [Friedmanniomyces simplex]|uniref:15-hydroxyprostaglandin dehydrogenase [NAD(+)] n=1 Tax=Friedmanniomyces simplex TaxID=329884 RepID=A0A4U0X0C7_9PEZI|nr:hypothetical protein B0A55_07262 [Friedmanniomyces simplex]